MGTGEGHGVTPSGTVEANSPCTTEDARGGSEPEEEPPVPLGREGGARVCQGPHVTLRMNFFLVF